MPEKVLKKWWASVLPQWKACFVSALAVGLLAHLYKITNWLPNWDSLVFRYDPQNMIEIGRWFLPVACAFSSFFDLPFLNGLLAILFHAVGAVCICKIFNVQKTATACMIGAVVVSFPTVTSVMMYNYVADGYGLAFLLSTLAAVCMTREKPRFVLAAVLIVFSTGIYQAYITVTIMLLLLKLIDDTVFCAAPFRTTLKRGACMLASGAAGMVVYYAVLKVLLLVFSTELLEYQGVNSAASLSGINLAGSLYTVKETFLQTFFDFSKGMSVYGVLNAVILAATVVYYLVHIVKTKLYKRPANLIAVCILTPMLIVGACALAIINAEVDYHNLMRMGYVVFYFFFLLLYERGEEKTETRTAVKRWTVLLIAAVLICNQIVIANVSYHKAQIAYEKSYGVLIRMADRIEQTPDADRCDEIVVLGALEGSEAYSAVLPPDITGITDGYILRADDEIVGQSVLCSALNDYCGKEYAFVSGDRKTSIAERDDVKAMGNWPSKDCMAVIDGVLVIKLDAEGEQ